MHRDRHPDRWRRTVERWGVERRHLAAEHGRRRDGRRRFFDVRSADVRRRDERVRAVPGRDHGQLRGQFDRLLGGLLLPVERADLLRDRRRRLHVHGRPERRRIQLSTAAHLRVDDRRDGVRGLSGRDAAELRRFGDRLHRRLLLRTAGAGVREDGRGARVRGSTSGGTTCAPAPRCADGNPCANFVGAKASSCTDTADGFEATCCFADGTLPIASGGGSGTGPSTGVDGGAPAMDAGTGGGTGGAGGTTDKPDGGGAGATTGRAARARAPARRGREHRRGRHDRRRHVRAGRRVQRGLPLRSARRRTARAWTACAARTER